MTPKKKLTQKEIDEAFEKAAKWDKLGEEIAGCYFNDDGTENEDDNIDLGTIGELAAQAYGWL